MDTKHIELGGKGLKINYVLVYYAFFQSQTVFGNTVVIFRYVQINFSL